MEKKVLIIGLGNTLREDDSLGALAVELLMDLLPEPLYPYVTLKTEYQVDIAQAALLTNYEYLFFIDAATDNILPVEIKKIEPGHETPLFTSHIGSISMLLYITQKVYGHVPECHLITLKGVNFAHGENLSTEGITNAELGAKLVIALLNKTLPFN